jgi:hypothetical protein
LEEKAEKFRLSEKSISVTAAIIPKKIPSYLLEYSVSLQMELIYEKFLGFFLYQIVLPRKFIVRTELFACRVWKKINQITGGK